MNDFKLKRLQLQEMEIGEKQIRIRRKTLDRLHGQTEITYYYFITYFYKKGFFKKF